ncbi:MAG: ankyrin repeat domain-containing protein, partial [Alphaproteobacteria bacterium]
NLEVIKLLIDSKANINCADNYGNTPLHLSIYSENLEVIKLLIDSKANIDVSNKLSKTPLEIANDKKNDKIILIIKNKSEVNNHHIPPTGITRSSAKKNPEPLNVYVSKYIN